MAELAIAARRGAQARRGWPPRAHSSACAGALQLGSSKGRPAPAPAPAAPWCDVPGRVSTVVCHREVRAFHACPRSTSTQALPKLRASAFEGMVRGPHLHVSSTQSLCVITVAVVHTDRSGFVKADICSSPAQSPLGYTP